MSPTERMREYYETLRQGDPLSRFFAESPGIVKCGISERLVGYDAVSAGLSEQTKTTDDWVVESHNLSVTDRGEYAWFGDVVRMAWTDTGTGVENDFLSRWSGAMERSDDGWVFVEMHVSRSVGRDGQAQPVETANSESSTTDTPSEGV
ncbi:MAG: SnoaL-like domain protein [uncultured archaeon A07HR60]|nr:MAG: SnoaL-like domain protein [uncultured archaeon A07HR60]